jgi:hypothetical protein
MNVYFPNHNPKVAPDAVFVEFTARVNGHLRECAVTAAALQDHFGAESTQPDDLLSAFTSGQHRIQEVARKTLRAADRCWLVSADFDHAH